MVDPHTLRSLLPGKIARVVALLSKRGEGSSLDTLKRFYRSQTYRLLEREETKYWWMSPEQLAATLPPRT